MKKAYKVIASALFIGAVSFIVSGFISDIQYQNKIPVRYLLDGTYEGNDTTFDYYKIDGRTDEVAVSLKTNTSESVTIPETYTSGSTQYKVTGIYRNAFSNKSVGSIYIPSSITTIDYEAFMNTSFTLNTKVEIPYSVEQMGTACFFKSNITEIYFSDGVTQNIDTCSTSTTTEETETKSNLDVIPDYCFAKCENLKTVSFSSQLTTIDESAFEYCSSISTLVFLGGLTTIKTNAFNYCASLSKVYLPNSLVNGSVADLAFSNCDSNLSFQISSADETTYNTFTSGLWNRKNKFSSDSYTCQRSSTDVNANGLWMYEEVDGGIKILKYYGEIDSSGLLAFPNTINGKEVISMDSSCIIDFESKLKHILLPKTLQSIPDSFFVTDKYSNLIYVGCVDGNNCYNYKISNEYKIDISAMSSLKTIGSNAFNNTRLKGNVTEINLPENLESIGTSAFDGFKKTTKLTLKNGRTNTNAFTIGNYAFRYLGQDKESEAATSDIDFPKELISIGANAFEKAKCLRNLTFEGDDTSGTAGNLTISSEAFFDCSGLVSLIIKDRTGTTTLNARAFAQWNGNYRDYSYKPSLQTVFLPKNISGLTSTSNEIFGRQIRCAFYCSGSAPNEIKYATYYFSNTVSDSTSETSDTDDMTYTSAASAFKLAFSYRCGIYENVSYESIEGSKTKVVHKDGDFTYVLDTSAKTAVVAKYHFNMEGEVNKTEKEVEVPSTVTFNGDTYTVNEVGTGAFGNSDSYDFANKNTSDDTYRTIKTVMLPDTITKIGHYAFFRCVGLENIGVKKENNGVTTYEMPSSLKSIGQMAFGLSGIKQILNLNSDCDFLFYGGSSQLTASNGRAYSSPFMNCPQLETITLNAKDNSKIKSLDGKALADTNGNILVVYPNYQGTDKSFVSSNFYYGAYRAVKWIKTFTISSSNFPNSSTDITPQAIFAGYTSKKSIREKCRFKSRATVSKMDNEASIDTLTLMNDSDSSTFVYPTDFLSGTKINVEIFIPYGGGNGTFPSKLLESVTSENNSVIFRVEQNSKGSGVYSNTNRTANLLDLTASGYTSIEDNAFKGCQYINELVLPTGFQTIGTSAFEESKIRKVTANSLVTINSRAFYNCDSLTTMDMVGNNLTSIGSYAFFDCDNIVNITLSNNFGAIGEHAFDDSKIQTVTVNGSLTSIGDYAFYNCESLTTITFPDNLTTIGSKAFNTDDERTPNKISTTKENADYLFIPKSVATLGETCFRNMDSVKSVVFESGSALTKIPNYAFDNCNALTSITFPENLTEIGNVAFWGDPFTEITIPDAVTSIGSEAFSNCKILTKVTLSANSNLTTIGSKAFSDCAALTEIMIPKKVTSIGSKSFYGCTSLKSLTFGEDMTSQITINSNAFENCYNSGFTTLNLTGRRFSVESDAFKNCNKLTNVTIGGGVIKLGDYVFNGDTKITTITFESGDEILNLGNQVFNSCPITEFDFSNRGVSLSGTFKSHTKLTKVIFGSKETTIGTDSFNGCTSLTNVTFGSGVKSIMKGAFENCTGLTSLDFTNDTSLTEINGFKGCTGLTSVSYASNVTLIGEEAFYGCSGLKNFTFSSITSLGKKAFYNSGLTKIDVTSALTSLGEECFASCTSLETAKFSSKGFMLSNSAFSGCTSLKSVIFLGDVSDGGYGSNPFSGCSSLVLVVLPSTFDISTSNQIFSGMTQLSSQNGTGIVCLSFAYDSSKTTGNFAKISDTYTARIAYQSASGTVASGTLIWEWTDNNKTSVKYHTYGSSDSTTVPTSYARKKDEYVI